MRHWLSTKAEEERTKQEEEKRRQEEERTRQESFRLEQRLVEQSMLRDSMKGGIPPQMIPVIFAVVTGFVVIRDATFAPFPALILVFICVIGNWVLSRFEDTAPSPPWTGE